VSVYVSEYLTSINRVAHRDVILRLTRIALLIVVTTVVVNVVLLRMATQPLRQRWWVEPTSVSRRLLPPIRSTDRSALVVDLPASSR
jgi:hypothetical protein